MWQNIPLWLLLGHITADAVRSLLVIGSPFSSQSPRLPLIGCCISQWQAHSLLSGRFASDQDRLNCFFMWGHNYKWLLHWTSSCVCLRVCACVHACVHACVYVRVQVFMFVCMRACMCACMLHEHYCADIPFALWHMQSACRTINHHAILSVLSTVMLHSIILSYEIWSILLFRWQTITCIHIRPRVSHDTTYIKGCRPTDYPLLLSRQRRHFGAPSCSVRSCLYQFV